MTVLILATERDISADRMVRAIPRHALVPTFYEQDPATGDWLTRDTTDSAWADRIYSNRAMFTKIGEATGSWGSGVVGLSSTSTPGLMARMLEALDVHDGHDVLEIGTGTGYNAALLAHRLGDTHVFSVDIDDELVDLARHRLATIGHRPILAAADGARGLPEHAPYDRIIATCSVPAIPQAWFDQTRIGGLILADLKLSVHAGNLVLLTRHADRAEGRFERNWGGFMALRTAARAGEQAAREQHKVVLRTTNFDTLRPWENLVAWFLAQLSVPTEIGYRHTLDEQTGRPTHVVLTGADGSWCEVSDRTANGARQVREAGPTALWRAVVWFRWPGRVCDRGDPGRKLRHAAGARGRPRRQRGSPATGRWRVQRRRGRWRFQRWRWWWRLRRAHPTRRPRRSDHRGRRWRRCQRQHGWW